MAENSTFSEVNEKYWDNAAVNNQYDSKPWQQDMAKQMIAEIRGHADWMGVSWAQKPKVDGEATLASLEPGEGEVKLLDYASGLGIASQALLPYVTQIRGIDVSENMVKEYNRRMKGRGIRPEDVFAVQGNLLDTTESASLDSPDFFNFDVVIVNAALHHFENPESAVQRLVKRLTPGKGVIVVCDFIPKEAAEGHHLHQEVSMFAKQDYYTIDYDKGHHHKHEASHTIAHEGFSKERMEHMIRDAGCSDFDYQRLEKPLKFGEEMGGVEVNVFIARGKRTE